MVQNDMGLNGLKVLRIHAHAEAFEPLQQVKSNQNIARLESADIQK